MNGLEQHLLFEVIDQVFSVDVKSVKSIVKIPKIYEVPQAPDFILGVINVEGEVLPLIDAGVKFNDSKIEIHNKSQVIILKNLDATEGINELAFLVNDVLDVKDIDVRNIQKLPTSKYKFDERFVDGMHEIDGDFCMQVNVNNLFVNELDEIVNNLNKQVEI